MYQIDTTAILDYWANLLSIFDLLVATGIHKNQAVSEVMSLEAIIDNNQLDDTPTLIPNLKQSSGEIIIVTEGA